MAALSEQELTRIKLALSEQVGAEASVAELRSEGDIVFAVVGLPSCEGVLLDRRNGEVEILRSALSLENYAWAAQHGFHLHKPNRLVITKVRDYNGAVSVLRAAFDSRLIRGALLDLEKLPVHVDLDWPQSALVIEQLRHSDAFDYEVPPLREDENPGPPPPAPSPKPRTP